MFQLHETFSSNILRYEQCLIVQLPHLTRRWTKMFDPLTLTLVSSLIAFLLNLPFRDALFAVAITAYYI